jgi:hypothetical protein
MKAWQFFSIMSAIYLAPHKPGAVNVGISLAFGVVATLMAVLDK